MFLEFIRSRLKFHQLGNLVAAKPMGGTAGVKMRPQESGCAGDGCVPAVICKCALADLMCMAKLFWLQLKHAFSSDESGQILSETGMSGSIKVIVIAKELHLDLSGLMQFHMAVAPQNIQIFQFAVDWVADGAQQRRVGLQAGKTVGKDRPLGHLRVGQTGRPGIGVGCGKRKKSVTINAFSRNPIGVITDRQSINVRQYVRQIGQSRFRMVQIIYAPSVVDVKFSRPHGTIPHRHRHAVRRQTGNQVNTHVPRVVLVAVITGKTSLGVVVGIEVDGNPPLSVVGGAIDNFGAEFGRCQCRQQHGCQNGDDGDDHQKLDQRKSPGRVISSHTVLIKPATRPVGVDPDALNLLFIMGGHVAVRKSQVD